MRYRSAPWSSTSPTRKKEPIPIAAMNLYLSGNAGQQRWNIRHVVPKSYRGCHATVAELMLVSVNTGAVEIAMEAAREQVRETLAVAESEAQPIESLRKSTTLRIHFFCGVGWSICFNLCSIIIFSCSLVILGNSSANCARTVQGEAPGTWTALP